MFRTLGRFAAAAALVASSATVATVLSTSTAGAANTAITANCPNLTQPQAINNGDTVTFTVGTGCTEVVIGQPSAGGILTVNGGSALTPGNPVAVNQGDTVVYTAPVGGAGSDSVMFLVSYTPSTTFPIEFPVPAPRSDSLTDNGNGSMTITYEPVAGAGSVWVSLFPSGTTCAALSSSTVGRLYVLAPNMPYNPLGASPVVIAAGSGAMTGVMPYAETTITAGSYEACMYYSGGNQGTLEQSLSITLSAVTPTTSTTTTASADPVAPAFTG